MVGLAPNHHAVQQSQLRLQLGMRGDTAVQHHRQCREVALERMHQFVAQRRNLAVLLGRQALEPGIAGVHDEDLATGLTDRTDEVAHKTIVLFAVYAYAVLDRHRYRHGITHGLDAIGHQTRLGHQTGAKRAALHALGRAAAVQVDLVIAPLRT